MPKLYFNNKGGLPFELRTMHKEMLLGRGETPIAIDDQVTRLTDFLNHIGYEVKYLHTGCRHVQVLHIVAGFTARRLGSKVNLKLEEAVSMYNWGIFSYNESRSEVLYHYYTPVVSTLESINKAYKSKPDNRPLTLQRSGGGLILGS